MAEEIRTPQPDQGAAGNGAMSGPQRFNWAEGNPAILPGEKYPQRIRWVKGHAVPLYPDECEPHTPMPDGYLAWHEWAERMSKTRDQRQCRSCGLWVVWEPKEDRSEEAAGEH